MSPIAITRRFRFVYEIGKCQRCMRQSFLAAFVLLCASGGCTFVLRGTHFEGDLWILYLPTAAAALLWIVHVIVYSLRTLSATTAGGYGASSSHHEQDRSVPQKHAHGSRRSAMGLFLRALGGAAIATAVPRLALAFNECSGRLTCPMTSCSRGGSYCCPKGYPILNLCNCRCYENVQGVIAAGCRSTSSCYDENF